MYAHVYKHNANIRMNLTKCKCFSVFLYKKSYFNAICVQENHPNTCPLVLPCVFSKRIRYQPQYLP